MNRTLFFRGALRGVLIGVLFCLTAVPGLAEEPPPERPLKMRIGVLNPPSSLNYFRATDIWSRKILGFFQMPLFVRDSVNGKRTPWLAAGPPEIGHDPYTVTVRLRDAMWDDGSPVTAGDLAFTVKVIQEFHVPAYEEMWRVVRKTEALDRKTIRFTLSEPSAEFLERTLFTSFVQQKQWQPVVDSSRDSDNPLAELLHFEPKRPAGNGPFYLYRYKKPYFIVLNKTPGFFAANLKMAGRHFGPHIDSLIFDFHPTAGEALAELEKGEIDFFWGDVPLDDLEPLKQSPKISIFTTQRRGYDYLVFNLQQTPFNDPAFRRAVGLLIDRKEIIKDALKGNGVPAYSVIPPFDKTWLDPRIPVPGKGVSPTDRVKKAREVLTQAGYTWSKGALVLPNGNQLEKIQLLTTCAGYKPYRMTASLLIKKWLSEAGIPVDVRMRPIEMVIKKLKRRSYDLVLMGWGHLPGDPGYLSSFFSSRQAGAKGKNYSGFKNSAFDELADQATRQTNFEKRRELVFRMQEIIAEELPCIPLYSAAIVEAVKKDVFRGWVKMPGGIGNLWSFMSLDLKEDKKTVDEPSGKNR